MCRWTAVAVDLVVIEQADAELTVTDSLLEKLSDRQLERPCAGVIDQDGDLNWRDRLLQTVNRLFLAAFLDRDIRGRQVRDRHTLRIGG